MPYDPDDLWCPDCQQIIQTPNAEHEGKS